MDVAMMTIAANGRRDAAHTPGGYPRDRRPAWRQFGWDGLNLRARRFMPRGD